MDSMLCFRQAQTLNRAGKVHKARLLTETSGMTVFDRLPPAAADALFPVVASANLSPSLRRISKKDFADGLILNRRSQASLPMSVAAITESRDSLNSLTNCCGTDGEFLELEIAVICL